MTESSASKSSNGAGNDEDMTPLSRSYARQHPTSDQSGHDTRYSAMEKAPSCGGSVQPLPAKSKLKVCCVKNSNFSVLLFRPIFFYASSICISLFSR